MSADLTKANEALTNTEDGTSNGLPGLSADLVRYLPDLVPRFESRVREIVREELAAHSEELAHDREKAIDVDARSAAQLIKSTVENDNRGTNRTDESIQDFMQLLEGYLLVLTTDGAQGRELVEDCKARFHARRNLVDERLDAESGVVGIGHGEASPGSDCGDGRSLGDAVGSGNALHISDPTATNSGGVL